MCVVVRLGVVHENRQLLVPATDAADRLVLMDRLEELFQIDEVVTER